MISKNLQRAREYETECGSRISPDCRPGFHLTPHVGWMNDPNGFSYFDGKYHMFYQYYPYNSKWGPMHWGHAVSEDMLHWEYLPAALAPDEAFDNVGCFSGSAVDMGDGRHLIIYTGVTRVLPEGMSECNAYTEKTDGVVNNRTDGLLDYDWRDKQVQCIAIGDGVEYSKYSGNPVIGANLLPTGGSERDFRDPKIWRTSDGGYNCIVGNRPEDGSGQILLFTSADGYKWQFKSILARNEGRYGTMWECPDFFMLDGKWVLLTSPCDMKAEGLEYIDGNGTLCLIGEYDEGAGEFTEECAQSIEYGIDFYAPQTVVTPDGRRVMIGWMQNWKTLDIKGANEPWFGQMTIPREISVKNGRLYQWPAREIEKLRRDRTDYKNVIVSGQLSLEGICGRNADIEMTLKPVEGEALYNSFELRFACGGGVQGAVENEQYTSLVYSPSEGIMTIDRSHSGVRDDILNRRSCKVRSGGEITLRIILDKYSAEIFVNGGEQAMSVTMYTKSSADGIAFIADGKAAVDVMYYRL